MYTKLPVIHCAYNIRVSSFRNVKHPQRTYGLEESKMCIHKRNSRHGKSADHLVVQDYNKLPTKCFKAVLYQHGQSWISKSDKGYWCLPDLDQNQRVQHTQNSSKNFGSACLKSDLCEQFCLAICFELHERTQPSPKGRESGSFESRAEFNRFTRHPSRPVY